MPAKGQKMLNNAMCGRLEMLFRRGFTDAEAAKVVGIAKSTLNNWKKDKRFYDFIQKAKEVADKNVERSLYERACGAKVKETKVHFPQCSHLVEVTKENGVKVIKDPVRIVTYTKELPPDTLACIFWLKNRKPKDYRDKVEHAHSGDMQVKLIQKAIIQSKKLAEAIRPQVAEALESDE